VRATLAVRTTEQAEVVRLAFFDDRPRADIKRVLGIPLGTVESRLRLAMSRLRGLMEDDLLSAPPFDAILIAQAVGRLPALHAAVPAVHLSACPHCGGDLRRMEEIGGAHLAGLLLQPLIGV
jgi:Sigma-70, region 4